MRAAQAATRDLGDEIERLGRRSSGSFQQSEESANRLERALSRLLETERRHQRQQEENARQTRRNRQEQQQQREETDRQTQSQDRLRRSTDQANRGFQLSRRSLVSLAAGAGAYAVASTTAGVAVAAFGAVAAPTLARVMSAQQDLAGSWESLTDRERASALGVRHLADEYKALARSYEPEALGAFNSVVSISRGLLPQLDKVVGATSGSVQGLIDRVGAFAAGPEVDGFMTFAATQAPRALDELGQTATTTGSLVLRLATDLEPVGMSMLTVANGALGLVNGLASVNPALAQLAVTGLLLRGPLLGVYNGIGNVNTRMRAGLAATRGMTAGQRALNLVARAGPNLYVAAGVGLAFYAMKAMNAKSANERLVDSLRVTYRAQGNNVAGYEAQAAALQTQINVGLLAVGRYRELAVAQNNQTKEVRDAKRAADDAISAQKELGREIQAIEGKARAVNTGAAQLSRTYRITATEARDLATAAGVDLSKSMDSSGRLTAQARLRIAQYKEAVEQASSPTWRISEALRILGQHTSTAEQKTKALAAAYDAQLGPALAAYTSTLQLKNGYAELSGALGRSRSGMAGNSAASRQLQQQLAAQIETAWRVFDAETKKTGSTNSGSAAIRRQLPILYSLAGRNNELRRMVDSLARSTGNVTGAQNVSRGAFLRAASAMAIGRDRAEALWRELNKIKSREVKLSVEAQGTWNQLGHAPNRDKIHFATGGEVPFVSGAKAGRDSVPSLLMPDEHVWTTREVAAAGGHEQMYRLRQAALRGELKGYATGGAVGLTSRSGSLSEVTRPAREGMAAMVSAFGSEVAAAWKKFAGAGGGVVGAARRWLGTPYSWGGGGIGGPSRGIGRGAGTTGFDCSGLTQYAWHAARGIDIGGVTYSQHPASAPIGNPRPGALGFNASLGHVVLASTKPGYVVEAPFTGSHVREVRKSMPDWRWPKAAYAEGGRVSPLEERLGRRFVDARGGGSNILIEAKTLQIAGDPGGLGVRGYAAGGMEDHVAQISRAGGPLRVWGEPETQGEAYIPLAGSKRGRSLDILSQVARKFGVRVTRMADGGILGGDDQADLNLGDLLQRWSDTAKPATKADVDAAKKARKTQADQAAAAQRALAKAGRTRADRIKAAQKRLARAYDKPGKTAAQRKSRAEAIQDAKEALAKAKRTDSIRDAERRLRKEREELNAATKNLKDTEKRAATGRQSPATQLGGALDLGIKNSGNFIRNLTTLADRGFGGLARQLLAMGGPEAEKLAWDAARLSDGKLKGLQDKLGTAERQQETLKNLPNILTVRSSLRSLGGQAGSWQALLTATGLAPGDLATAVKLMSGDLSKTTSGQALLADMKRHGYVRGGWIGGPAGIDRTPIMATAGEYVINRRSAARHAGLIEAINADRVGDALVRRYAQGGWVGTPRSGAAAGEAKQVTQHFHELPFSPSQMAREAAREAAWVMSP